MCFSRPSSRKACNSLKSKPVFITHPMYFVRSGYIGLPSGSLRGAGNNGYFWSSVAYPANSQSAFSLDFAYPSDNYTRYLGFSLRKLVSMPHPCISSVVAISIFHTVHFGTQAIMASPYHLPLTLLVPNMPSILT